MTAWLVAFAEIAGLRWVLDQERMAFTSRAAARARRIDVGDGLVLYVTRGAFHNPTRDRSQIAGLATVATPVRRLAPPVEIGGRAFAGGCDIGVEIVLPERQGIAFEPLISKLTFIRRKDVWGQYLRAGLVALPPSDFQVIRGAISKGVRS